MFKKLKFRYCRWMMCLYHDLRLERDTPWLRYRHQVWSVRTFNALVDMPE